LLPPATAFAFFLPLIIEIVREPVLAPSLTEGARHVFVNEIRNSVSNRNSQS
jgi:hypothetical protein